MSRRTWYRAGSLPWHKCARSILSALYAAQGLVPTAAGLSNGHLCQSCAHNSVITCTVSHVALGVAGGLSPDLCRRRCKSTAQGVR
jgi:hypothetical protein